MKSYKALVLKFLKKQKKTTALIMLSIVLSGSLIMVVNVIGASIKQGMIEREIEANGNWFVEIDDLSNKQEEYLKVQNGVKKVGNLLGLGFFSTEGSPIVSLEGWDKNLFNINRISLLKGRFPENKNEIILNELHLKELGYDITLDQEIELNIGADIYSIESGQFEPMTFQLVGIIPVDSELVLLDISSAFVSLETAIVNNVEGTLFRRGFIELTDKSNKEKIASRIKNDVENEFPGSQIRLNERLINVHNNNSEVFGAVLFFLFIIVTTVVIVIYNIFHISVIQRKNYWSTLRALGIDKRKLKKLLLMEGLIYSSVAIPVGIGLGILLSWFAIAGLSVINDVTNSMTVSWVSIVVSTLVTLFSVFLAIFLPAKTAAKSSPIEAITGNIGSIKSGKVKMTSIDKVMNRLFSIIPKMAYQNLWRNRKKSIFTILSLSIAVVIFVFFNFISASADVTSFTDLYVKGDYSLNAINFVMNEKKLYTEEEFNEVKSLKGVEKISATQFVFCGISHTFKENELPDELINIKDDLNYYEGNYFLSSHLFGIDNETIIECKNMLINGDFRINVDNDSYEALVYNPHNYMDLNPGDELSCDLEIIQANSIDNYPVTIKVIGIISELPVSIGSNSQGPMIFLSNSSFQKMTGINDYSKFEIYGTDEIDGEKIRKISKRVPGRGFTSYKEAIEMNRKKNLKTRILLLSISFIIGAIGLLNLINTISTNLIVRKREMGMLRAIGIKQKQLRNMLIYESAFLGGFSAILGGVFGLLISFLSFRILKEKATYLIWNVPWLSLVLVVFITVIVSILATIPSVKKISTMNIIEAVQNLG